MPIGIPLLLISGFPGGAEILLVFVVALVLLGPRRLPEAARQIGKVVSWIRRASQDFRDQLMNMDQEPPHSPPKNNKAEIPHSDSSGSVKDEGRQSCGSADAGGGHDLAG